MHKKTQRDFTKLEPALQAKLLKASIVPRPIAWITSLNEDDTINLAPFSYFNMVADNILMVSFIPTQNGYKDTLDNILRTKEAVINASTLEMIHQVNDSSKTYEKNESEADLLNIKLVDSLKIKTPSVEDAKINLEVKLLEHIPITDSLGNKKSDMLLLEVIHASFDKDIINEEKDYIDISKLAPISRLAGPDFGTTQIEKNVKRI